MKIFYWRKTLLFNCNAFSPESFLKKYFCSLENGCIFASAFAEKTAVEKKRQLFETDEKKEIACVGIHIKICVRHEDESKGKNKQFLQ
jgi:hypothetical protein